MSPRKKQPRCPWIGLQPLEPRLLASGNLRPDLVPLESGLYNYMDGWTLDTTEQPGHTLLRLTSAVANLGAGPAELRGGAVNPDGTQEVSQRIYDDVGGFRDRQAGNFIFHPTHGHIHFEAFAQYNLRRVTEEGGVGEIVADGGKTSFCLEDVARHDVSLPGAPQFGPYQECGQVQGISVGWTDVYDQSLPDQWIDVTGVPGGLYWLEVVADPENRILESDEGNNTARLLIDLNTPDEQTRRIGFNEFSPAVFTDAQGRQVTVTLRGRGRGEIELPGPGNADAERIELFYSTRRSRLSIAVGQEAATTIGSVVVNGSLKSWAAPSVNIAGNVLIRGVLESGVFGDFAGGVINLGGENAARGDSTSLTFARIAEADIFSSIPLASFSATRWEDGDDDVDILRAPRLDRMSIAGDFEAGLRITGEALAPQKRVLTTVEIAGRLGREEAHIAWQIGGAIGAIKVGGILNTDIRTPSILRLFTVTTAPPIVGFINSNLIAGALIGSANLGVVQTDNGGTRFGLTSPVCFSAVFTTPQGTTRTARNSPLVERNFEVRLVPDAG